MKKIKTLFVLITAFGIFGGCATKTKGVLSEGNLINNAEGVLVEMPVPVPEQKEVEVEIPKQYKKIEKFKPANNRVKGKTARIIEAANASSAQRPKPGKFINSITCYDYMPGALYQLYCSPYHITDIMLQPGEILTGDAAAGDTVRWKVDSTVSGNQTHVVVKPLQEGLMTNILIMTNKHTYHIEARSFKKTYQAAIKWNYPHERFLTKRNQALSQNRLIGNSINNINVENINFSYSIKGVASFKPEKVFDDGFKTYIKFPESIKQTELPPLFLYSGRNTQLVNYRFKNNYYIVDRLFEKAVLQMGEKKREKVFIYNNAAKTKFKKTRKHTRRS